MDEDEKSPTLSDAELEKAAGGWPNFGGYVAPTIQHRLHKLEKKSEEKKEETPK
jgi:hypothetical protein